MEALLRERRFEIPEFLSWTPTQWNGKGHEFDEIRDNGLGWDVTDYGKGHFRGLGITLITLRNGNVHNNKYRKTYSEKLIMIEEGQVAPMHFHWKKMEDIINRGGGNLIFNLHNAAADGRKSDGDVEINKDGRREFVKAGSDVLLLPGESLSLYPYCYHGFRVELGSRRVLVGEVSMCNDDHADNKFLEELPRFPQVEEDEAPYRLLCTEYPPAP